MGNRSKFHRFLSVVMVLTMILSFFSTTVFASGSDIKGHWAEKDIKEWIEKGLVSGYKDGNFKPNTFITRAEFIALVNRAYGLTESSDSGYKDVSPNDWYYSEVLIAKAAGYIGGYQDGTIKPKNNISRQEVAAVLARLLDVENDVMAVEQFKDKHSIPQWSKGVVGGIVAKGLMKGFADGTFKPSNNTTRAEAVVILKRALEGVSLEPQEQDKVYDSAGTYGPAEGSEIVHDNVVITASGVTLQNLIIEGDLTIAEEVGDGEVYLKGVTVKGKTFVNGGGENSVHFEDTVLLTVIVNKVDGTVRIVATGKTTVQEITLQTSAKVEQSGTEGAVFKTVTLSEALPKDSKITLIGEFDSVEIFAASIAVEIPRGVIKDLKVVDGAAGTSINLSKDARIISLVVDALLKVLGTGVIENAKVNVNGVSFERQPNKADYADGVKNTSSNTGGGGGGGSSSDDDDSSSDKDPDELGKIQAKAIDQDVRLKLENISEDVISFIPYSYNNTFLIETNGTLNGDEVLTTQDVILVDLPEELNYDVANKNGLLEITIDGIIEYPTATDSDMEEFLTQTYESARSVFADFPMDISVKIKPTAMKNKGAIESDSISLQIDPPTIISNVSVEGYTTDDTIKLSFKDSIHLEEFPETVGIGFIDTSEVEFTSGDAIVIFSGDISEDEYEDELDFVEPSDFISIIFTNQDFVTDYTVLNETINRSEEGVLAYSIGDVVGEDHRLDGFSINEPFEFVAIPGKALSEQSVMLEMPEITEDEEEENIQAFMSFLYYYIMITGEIIL